MIRLIITVFLYSLVFYSLQSAESYNFTPLKNLSKHKGMPDPFIKADGSRVKLKEEWPAQRVYLKAMLEHYIYGTMPPRPKKISLKKLSQKKLFENKAIHERYSILLNRNQKSVTFHMELIRPPVKKRLPGIIKNCQTFFQNEGKAKETAEHDFKAAKEAISRGYVFCKFNRCEIAADHGDNRNTGIFSLYPEYEWGTIAAWAWAHGVVADALNELELIDMKKIVATGHSKGGKTALCAGIYDERVAITAPNSSGTGGTGSLRYFEKDQREQRITHHTNRFPHWWVPRFFEFGEKEDLLPFDAHTAKALIAPRALINAHARQDYWANPYGTELTYRVADKVFNWLGVANQQGIHWRDGGHAQDEVDWAALLDFADWKFFEKKSSRSFSKLQYPNAELPVFWKVPR